MPTGFDPLAARPQFTFAPENFTTFAHFAVSSAMKVLNCADGIGSVSPPRSFIRALICGSANPATMLSAELVDDCRGRAGGRTDSVPGRRLETRQRFGDGRDFRQHVGTFGDGHRQRPDFAGPDKADRGRDRDDEGLDLSGRTDRRTQPPDRDKATCTRSTPAISFNSSIPTCIGVPMPGEAMLILPGLALA